MKVYIIQKTTNFEDCSFSYILAAYSNLDDALKRLNEVSLSEACDINIIDIVYEIGVIDIDSGEEAEYLPEYTKEIG